MNVSRPAPCDSTRVRRRSSLRRSRRSPKYWFFTWQALADDCGDTLAGHPPDRKRRRDDLVHAVAVPAPLRHVRPEILRRLTRLRIDLILVHTGQPTALHQDLTVHDHRIHVAPGARVHQRLDRIRVDGGAE